MENFSVSLSNSSCSIISNTKYLNNFTFRSSLSLQTSICTPSSVSPGFLSKTRIFSDRLRTRQTGISWRGIRIPLIRVSNIRASANHYSVLGISPDADKSEIKKAYRQLARKHHPDVSRVKGSEERFRAIKEAYEVLADENARLRYDSNLFSTRVKTNSGQKRQEERGPPFWGSPRVYSRVERERARGGERERESRNTKAETKTSQSHKDVEEARRMREISELLTFWQKERAKRRWHPSGFYGFSMNNGKEYGTNYGTEYGEYFGENEVQYQRHPFPRKTERVGGSEKGQNKSAANFQKRREKKNVSSLDFKVGMFILWLSITLWGVYGYTTTAGFLALFLFISGDSTIGYKLGGLAAWGIGGKLGLGLVVLLHVLVFFGYDVREEFVGSLLLLSYLAIRRPDWFVLYAALSIGLMAVCGRVLLQRW